MREIGIVLCYAILNLGKWTVNQIVTTFDLRLSNMVSFHDDTKTVNTARLIFYPLLFITTVLWLIHTWQRQTRLFKLGNVLPGPPHVPFFGNALLALGKRPDQLVNICLEYADTYGTVIRGWLGSKLAVFILDADDIEVILNSQIHIDKADEYRFFKPWLGDGLLISTGSKWRSHRKMIAPTFHINILKSFVGVFNQNSKNVVEKMRSEIGKTFDVHDHMSTATVDILLETAMGITRKTQDESGFDYAMAVMKMCDIIHQRHYKFWLRFDALFKFTSFFAKQKKLLSIIHGLTNKVIKSKKQTYFENKARGFIPPTLEELTRTVDDDNVLANDSKTVSDTVFKGYRDDLDFNDENDVGEKKRLAFLDLMIESVQNGTHQLTDHEIKEEVDTIMFEGHDTTAAGSSFVLCLLGIYKDIQAKVYNELYEIFGDSDRPATFADTLEMKYLERVILETLRLYPPVPVIARKLNQDVKIATNSYVLPTGATIVIGMYKVHRSPKYYKDPDTFNPDNFLPENSANRHYYSFIPFSAGPRSCVGRKYALLKLKILLSTILRNYECTSTVPEKDFKLLGDIILKRSDGFTIKIEPRIRKPVEVA
nr:cytochrome P450 4g15 [Helicoverpa armigera]